ncbi:hypothetical protein [Brachybacterium sp. J153]|uniref:hypothetical protein n=1 Tax=Brachybacterium sp. J153 TaxID=3116488 RepID=UPI002E761184|nr:hypothetical protein [Brachybacterium sp. J153]MEE1617742.1 hypothetical protein [Brachybacterium sp. J153]
MTESRRRGDRRDPSTGRAPSARRAPSAGPARRVRRPVEMTLVGLGMIAALIAHGGFTLVMNRIDQPTFEAVVMPALVGEDSGLSGEEARVLGDTLAAWLGMSLVVLLLLAVAGIAHHRARPARRAPGWWFLAAGAVCLLGSQLILYPVAFLFFAAAALFALRPLPEGSPR